MQINNAVTLVSYSPENTINYPNCVTMYALNLGWLSIDKI